MRSFRVLAFFLVPALSSAEALAQANANAVAKAVDGFRFSSGSESVGLYDQSSVRGFDLQAAGNYRLNGTYFVKNSGTSSIFLDHTTVRIGHNTLELPFPGPLGVVDFTLRDPARGEKGVLTAGLDFYSQPYLEANLRHRSKDGKLSYSLGASRVFDVRDDQGGQGGNSILFAGTVRLSSGALKAQLFAGDYEYEQAGTYRVQPSAGTLPPRIQRGRYLGPEWARDKAARRIVGLVADAGADDAVGIGVTSVVSQEDPQRRSREIFRNVTPAGTTDAREILLPHQPSLAWSTEARAHVQLRRGRLFTQFDLSARSRLQKSRFGGGTMVSLGPQEFGSPIVTDATEPSNVPPARSLSHIRQFGLGISNRGRWGDWLRWNAGLLKTGYRNRVAIPLISPQTSKASPWLYNLGLAARPFRRVEVYGSLSRGLEESGVAPVTASNANQVLDPVIVTQKEIGMRLSPRAGVTLLAGWFDTRKPYAAIDRVSGVYRFVGDVEHKGVELSLAGHVVRDLTLVVGGVWLDPTVRRKDLDLGKLRPVAVSRLRISASAEAKIAALPGLSVDGGIVATGKRAAQSLPVLGSGQLMVPATTLVNAGARYSTRIGTREMIVRGQVQNLFNRFAWGTDASETLAPIAPRTARLIVSTLF